LADSIAHTVKTGSGVVSWAFLKCILDLGMAGHYKSILLPADEEIIGSS
jgi:hypothetical protein